MASEPIEISVGRVGADGAASDQQVTLRQQQGLAQLSGLEQIQEQSEREKVAIREPRAIGHTANVGDHIFNWVTAAFAGLVIVVLVGMLAILFVQSRTTITQYGLSFLTSSTWNPVANEFGGAASILGTVYTSLLAILIAGPVGVMIAIFLAELAPRPIRFPLGFVVELLAAVPSIVFGLWALYVLVPIVRDNLEPTLISWFGNTPLFTGAPLGLGFLPAIIILAIMVLPTIAAISRDVMLAVPNSQREAMLALGATRWETIWKVVVPAARSGIIGGIILGLGRAIGETMAVQMVIGNVTSAFKPSLLAQGTTITATLVNQFSDTSGDLWRSALIELSLILLLIAVLLNVVARLLVWRVSR